MRNPLADRRYPPDPTVTGGLPVANGRTSPPQSRSVKPRRVMRGLTVSFLIASIATGLAASWSSASSNSSTLQVATVVPFTGPDAAFGPLFEDSCIPAIKVIDAEGGVLGHQLKCTGIDTRGDPADAIPVVAKLLASQSTLAAVIGPSSDEAAAVVPIFNRAKVTMFLGAGQSEFDKVHFPYVWRLTPPDAATGIAEALWAKDRLHATRVAAVYVANTTGQGNVPNAVAAFQRLGGHVVLTQQLTPAAASYSTEAAQLIRANPQVILFDADAQTAATYLSELKQQGGLRPFVAGETIAQAPWVQSVGSAIGPATLTKYFVAMEGYSPSLNTPGWVAFRDATVAARSQIGSSYTSEYLTDTYEETGWDAMNLMALAMLATHSTVSAVYNGAILGLTQPGAGKVVVHTFAQGKAALAAGKHIQWSGASGQIVLDSFHSTTGDYAAVTIGPHSHNAGILTAKQITPLLSRILK